MHADMGFLDYNMRALCPSFPSIHQSSLPTNVTMTINDSWLRDRAAVPFEDYDDVWILTTSIAEPKTNNFSKGHVYSSVCGHI